MIDTDRISDNLDLSEVKTQDLKGWAERLCLCPYISDEDIPLCLCVVDELNIREGIGENIAHYSDEDIEELINYDSKLTW